MKTTFFFKLQKFEIIINTSGSHSTFLNPGVCFISDRVAGNISFGEIKFYRGFSGLTPCNTDLSARLWFRL
jgi:hypothetical protein